MGICGRFVCAMFLSLGESFSPLCSPFLMFCLGMGIFVLLFLLNDIVQLHINLCVFGSCVGGKGESVRTGKG
jgi:hypothetical protein